MKRAYVDIPDGQIHYRTEGDGEAVIFLHMAVASSGEFQRVIPIMGKKYRAIALDFPGYGESYPTTYQYQIREYARVVINFMDALGIEKASVVGHHTGAVVGVEMAITWPKRVDKLILSSLSFFQDETERTAQNKNKDFHRVEISADGSHLMEWWRRATRWEGTPLEAAEERLLDYVKAGSRGEELHWACHAYIVNEKLPLVKCPTLVLSGTLDPFYPKVEDIKSLIPRSKITIIDKGPCYISRIKPKEFSEAIMNFLENPGI